MKLWKSVLASAMVLVGTSAFAAGLKTVTVGDDVDTEAFRLWSSQCVGNVDLDHDVIAQYRLGEEGEFTEVKIEKHTVVLFRQPYSSEAAPLAMTIKFMSKETDGTEMSYTLEDTITRVRPLTCNFLENYRFQATDAGDGSVDLVHVQ